METWLPIVGFEQTHEVSNLGRVRSKTRMVYAGSRGISRSARGRMLHPTRCKDGYLRICLNADSNKAMRLVHRLVAEAFIPNPKGLPAVNHIDFDKSNNTAANLEWCDALYNIHHTVKAGRSRKLKGGDHRSALAVEALDDQGAVMRRYPSMSDAAEAMGKPRSHAACISQAITHGWRMFGFHWRKAG